jgi:hypothetical protein
VSAPTSEIPIVSNTKHSTPAQAAQHSAPPAEQHPVESEWRRRLWPLVKRHRGILSAACLLAGLYAVVTSLLPLVQ